MSVQDFARRRAFDRVSQLIERTSGASAESLASSIAALATPRATPDENNIYSEVARVVRSRAWVKAVPGGRDDIQRLQGFLLRAKHDASIIRTLQ